MKKVIFTVISMILVGNAAFAQWSADSVMMGPGSINDVFYSLKNGSVKTENNKNWHVAFSLGSMADSGAVWANHNTGNSFVKVYNVHKDISQWATVVLDDTLTASLSFNNDQGWYQGALNDVAGGSSTQFGWGTYNSTSHDVVGDSIFIIKANGIFYKFFINSLVGSGPNFNDWNFQIGDFAGNTVYDTIKFTNYQDRRFAYYDLAAAMDANREPSATAWDMVFNRYSTNNPMSGPNPFNNVIGALSNKGVKVVKTNMVHVDSAFSHYGDYISPWPATSGVISTIGYNWKTFTPPTTWTVPDSVSYLVQDVPGNLYQLQFLGYGGSGAGVIYLRKRVVVPTAVNDIHSAITSYEIFPNPAQGQLHLMINSKEVVEARLVITSITGQVVYNSSMSILSGLNTTQIKTASLPAGNYVLSVKGKGINLNEIITVLN